MNSNSRRGEILAAACSIVKTHGVEKLTLEAVAKEAGVSKGGLLHHFPNKAALIQGMVEEQTDQFVSDIRTRAARNDGNDGAWSRAYIESTSSDIQKGNGLGTALIAALFANPDLLVRFQEEYSTWQHSIENDGIDPATATIVRLAADGLWFSEMFGLGRLDGELRDNVIRRLIQMTH